MADVGRSTAEHVSRQELRYPYGHEGLDNYGAWFRCAPDGATGAIVQPMFRDIASGYRTSSEFRTTYDENHAIEVDQLMAVLLSKQDVAIVFCKYVECMPSRLAAKSLSTANDRITINEYALRLEAVVARMDTALFMKRQSIA